MTDFDFELAKKFLYEKSHDEFGLDLLESMLKRFEDKNLHKANRLVWEEGIRRGFDTYWTE